MKTYIKKLQSKPEDSKKQILFWSLVICMSLVCLVWITSLGPRFNKEQVAKTEEEIKPFTMFGQAISDTYDNVSASVASVPSKDDVIVEEKEINEKQIDLIPVEQQ